MARHAADFPWLDAQGLLRFPADFQKWVIPDRTPFANLFADAQGRRVGLVPCASAQPGSFRLLMPAGRPALFLKSALRAAELDTSPGVLMLQQDEGLLIVRRPDVLHSVNGNWMPVHCRSSADIPMVSLDPRGTLTLDRLCVRMLGLVPHWSAQVAFDPSSAMVSLTFSTEGPLAVRMVASRAEISLRGTLSFLGLPLPVRRVRYTAHIQGSSLQFSLRDPFLSYRF